MRQHVWLPYLQWCQDPKSVDKDISEASKTLVEVLDDLVGLTHLALLDHRMDIVLDGEFKHFADLPRGADQRAVDTETLEDDLQHVEGRQCRSADLNEGAVGAQQIEEVVEGDLRGADGTDDDVKGTGVLGGPVRVVIGGNVISSAELEHLVLFRSATRKSDDLVSTQSLGEQNAKVAKTTSTHDADVLAGSAIEALERRVHSDAPAEHGRSFSRIHAGRKLEDPKGRATPVSCETTVSLLTVRVAGTVSAEQLGTEVLLSIFAGIAFKAGLVGCQYGKSSDVR